MTKRILILVLLAATFGASIFLSLDMFNRDVLHEESREAIGYFARLVAMIALQYIPLFIFSLVYRRWWWVIAVLVLPLGFAIGSAGGFNATLVILLVAPFAASLLSLFAPRLSFSSSGSSGETLNSQHAKSFWD